MEFYAYYRLRQQKKMSQMVESNDPDMGSHALQYNKQSRTICVGKRADLQAEALIEIVWVCHGPYTHAAPMHPHEKCKAGNMMSSLCPNSAHLSQMLGAQNHQSKEPRAM